jgi:uncharacterized protein (TIGR03663 family)
MHTDEAVHAIKFGTLLEENEYQYDPYEYHGPTLNYFTLIPALSVSPKKLAEIDERTLRIVPVFFGMCLILGLFLLKSGLSRSVVFFASLFLAVSPAMVFYSRYYIQEMLLVSFSFGTIVSGYRYLKNRNPMWAVFAGIFLGLMHATKESFIIAFGAMLLALFLTGTLQNRQKGRPFHFGFKIKGWHILIFAATACVISALFYSSFFTHPKGILDSFMAYKNYLQRAGQNSWHLHPWFYYFKLLLERISRRYFIWNRFNRSLKTKAASPIGSEFAQIYRILYGHFGSDLFDNPVQDSLEYTGILSWDDITCGARGDVTLSAKNEEYSTHLCFSTPCPGCE